MKFVLSIVAFTSGILVAIHFTAYAENDSGRQLTKEERLINELHEKYGVEGGRDRSGRVTFAIVEGERIKDAPAAVKRLGDIDTIESLRIQNAALDRAAMTKLCSLPKLTKLDLLHCEIADKELDLLSNLPSLTELELSNKSITDKSLEHLKSVKRLRRLRLDHASIKGDGLVNLEKLPLEYLHLPFVPLSDNSLESLGKIQTLEHLDLSYTPISYDGLKRLSHLYRLFQLDVDKRITQEEVDRFLKEQTVWRVDAQKKGVLPKNYPKLEVIRVG